MLEYNERLAQIDASELLKESDKTANRSEWILRPVHLFMGHVGHTHLPLGISISNAHHPISVFHRSITYMTQVNRKSSDFLEGHAILSDHTVFFCAMLRKPLYDRIRKSLDCRNLIRLETGVPIWIKSVIACIVCERGSEVVQEFAYLFRLFCQVIFRGFLRPG